MKDLLGQLVKAPRRPGGILDIPFDEYVQDVSSPVVASLLETHSRFHKRPTLRLILADPRFRRWVEISARSPICNRLEHELKIIRGVIEEEHILDDEPGEPAEPPAAPPPPPAPTLREWAEQAGVAARLDDPSAALLTLAVRGPLWHVLRSLRGMTVADVHAGDPEVFERARAYLGAGERKRLSVLAEAYVRQAGERALVERREEARIAALGHVPAGEGVGEFLAALEVALARPMKRSAPALTVSHASFGGEPRRLEICAPWAPDAKGRSRDVTIALLLDDWRGAPLETRVRSEMKEGRTPEAAHLVLRSVRRILADPRHELHAALVAYLNEPSWTRVLASLDALAAKPTPRAAASVEWRVTTDGVVRVTPYVSSPLLGGDDGPRQTTVEVLVRGHLGAVSVQDEAVARALWNPEAMYVYGYNRDEQARERAFVGLSLLAGHDGVRGKGGVRLRIRAGSLGVALEPEGEGLRFVFDVDGERLDASELRAGLDAAGYLIHVEPTKGRVLLAHVGTRQAIVLGALVSEGALFPEAMGPTLAERVLGLQSVLPVRLPASLLGEPVEADARPLVRVARDGVASLSLSWLVRPIAGGPALVAARGPEQVVAHVGGRAVVAVRSHADEQRRLDALRSRLPEPVAQGPLADVPCLGIETTLAVIASLREAVAAGEAVVEWPRTLPRVVGTASWSKLHLRVTAQRDWFGVSGAVEVDGEEITLAELLAARQRGDRFVTVGADKLVALEEELRVRLDELDAIARPAKKAGLELVNAAVPALVDLLASRDQVDAVPAFWSLLARIDAARASDPRLPRGFAKVLRAYQVDGFRWMSRLAAWGAGACLADEMGLGKTVQALALLVARSKDGPALVVAPTSVGPNWIHEAERFAPSLNPIFHRGAGRAAALSKLGPGDLLVTSYELLARDVDALSELTFSTLILDEAQAIKNGATTRARAARALRADFRLALTGTPVENRLAELFSLMEFLNPGFFGSEQEFRARYVVPIERDRDATRSAALARAVRPFLLRRKKADVLAELPARTEVTRAIERAPAERRLYEAARQAALAALSGADEDARFQVLAELMRLRRLACHPRLLDDSSTVASSKLEAFLGLVSELREGGHRALVFSQFTGHLALVQDALRAHAVPYLYLDGATPVPERTRRVKAFQAGEGDLFLISLKAGGTGLNLTAADTVIHLDPWWNPAVEDQATDRAHRIGQTRPVTVIRLIAQGTIEEAVLALHADKRELAESILEGSAASGKLSIAELGALIREGAAEG